MARKRCCLAAVYMSDQDEGYSLNTVVDHTAIVGVTENVLSRAPAGRWDLGAALQVRLLSGALSSVSVVDVLNGKNLAFVGSGRPYEWEALQF